MTEAKVKVLRNTVELSEDQAEFVAALRAILDDALAGRAVGLVGVVCDSDGEIGYCVAGGFASVGDTFLALHNVADMVRAGDLEEILGIDDEDEDAYPEE